MNRSKCLKIIISSSNSSRSLCNILFLVVRPWTRVEHISTFLVESKECDANRLLQRRRHFGVIM
jgi:hypothetical protein